MCPVLLDVSGFVEDGCRKNSGRNESEGIKKRIPVSQRTAYQKVRYRTSERQFPERGFYVYK